MRGRPILCSVLVACAAVVFAPWQPPMRDWTVVSLLLLVLAMGCVSLRRWAAANTCRRLMTLAWVLATAAVMLTWTAQRVWLRLDDALAPGNIDRVSRVELRVVGLPRLSADNRSFHADVLSSNPAGVPRRIQVSWSAPGWRGHGAVAQAESWPFPEIVPGQVWRMALMLRPPAGERNPHGFDYEGHVFAQGIRAVGSVRGNPVLLRDDSGSSLEVIAQRLRHRVREHMQPYLQNMRHGAVLTALSIGDQAGVPAADWTVFNRSGLTHLVSISGSHITLIAAFGGVAVRAAWRRLRWRGRCLGERLPAQLAGAWAALIVAWLYCLLAGWGVPARRTFLMLAVIALAYTLRLPLSASRLLLLAAVAVVLFDPWALMATGFWLSFGAVAVLMAVGNRDGSPVGWRRWWYAALTATRLQMAITLALLPLLARMFHEVSLVSPLANAYAIPVIGLLITPLSLLSALFAVLPGMDWLAQATAWMGHSLLQAIMVPTHWLAALPAASIAVAAVPRWVTLLALAGIGWALLPSTRHAAGEMSGLLARLSRPAWPQWPGWLLVLPALLWRPAQPGWGDWRMTVLDSGQSGAAVLQTRQHAFLFDTGLRSGPERDSGSRTIAPFLRSQGIRQLDTMIVSHADLDHAGGASGVLRAVPVRQSYSPFDLPAYLRREARMMGSPDDLPPMPQADSPCAYGQHWEVDGVSFAFLWPLPPSSVDAGRAEGSKGKVDTNAMSCVLLVRGAHHAVLLTGDIAAPQERLLAERGLEAVDVVLAPHHGSRFSSSAPFIAATRPAHVIAQAGLWNRFGHPHAQAVRRWQRDGAWFWRTDLDGAIQVVSQDGRLDIAAIRDSQPRYWQLPCAVRCDPPG